jgi:endonuclease YncB( thermonuclease family)
MSENEANVQRRTVRAGLALHPTPNDREQPPTLKQRRAKGDQLGRRASEHKPGDPEVERERDEVGDRKGDRAGGDFRVEF